MKNTKTRWEHKHLSAELEHVEILEGDLTNVHGAEGWEAYSAQILDGHLHYFLKRRLEDSPE